MAKGVRFSTDYSSSNWACLPDDLLHSIIDKIFYIPDYIRFSAVCKSWNSIASIYKEKFIKQSGHQLPWLLTSSWSDETETKFNLYNYKTSTVGISNIRLRIPQADNQYCYGSSHGWLFFMENKSSLILLNPLFGTIIRLPPLVKENFRKPGKFILSRDPSFGSFEVLAVSCHCAVIAHLKFGDEFWTYSQRFMSIYEHSFIFYKNRILGASYSGQIVNIDVINDTTTREIKIRRIVSNMNFTCYLVSYLVETTKGDLLMVLRCPNCRCGGHCERYKIYKLVELNEKFECVLVRNLDGHCLFLGKSRPVSVLASNYPSCKANSIYYSYIHQRSIGNYGVEEFNVEDQIVRMDRSVATYFRGCWIVPSMINDQVCR